MFYKYSYKYLSGKKLELIENRFVFQVLAQNYGIIIII